LVNTVWISSRKVLNNMVVLYVIMHWNAYKRVMLFGPDGHASATQTLIARRAVGMDAAGDVTCQELGSGDSPLSIGLSQGSDKCYPDQ